MRKLNSMLPMIVGSWLAVLAIVFGVLALLATDAKAENTLVYLNAQRAQFGLYPLLPDPQLQAKAEWACQTRARRGMSGHLQGSRPVVGRWEGTGMRSGRGRGPAGRNWDERDILACYQNSRRARYAGCSSVRGRGGKIFYQLNLR